jgi:hypothetical protein
MTARVLTIKERHLQTPGQLASLADFTCVEGEEIDPKVVRDNPDLSLYCFDDTTRRAIFVELPPAVDLTKSPFVYMTQGEQAERLIAVSYDTFTRLAAELPKIDDLIPIYITGRSGSTLISHIFNELDTVVSLSEPDAANQFAYLRDSDGNRDAELCNLLDSTVRFLFKPNRHKKASTYALKFRSEAGRVMDLYQATFPQAKNLFSYRDAVGWTASFYRLCKSWGDPDHQPLSAWLPFFEQGYKKDEGDLRVYLGESDEDISLIKFIALWWLFPMEAYLTQYERGIPVLAVRYDDLNAHREKVLSGIFAYCGLPVSGVKEALRAFEQDAQAGTPLAREDAKRGNALRLSEQQLADIHDVLQRHPVIKTPDYMLPGTLTV